MYALSTSWKLDTQFLELELPSTREKIPAKALQPESGKASRGKMNRRRARPGTI
jgi:hypothetical protein